MLSSCTHLRVVVKLVKNLVLLADKLHVLPLEVVLLVGKDDVELRLLLVLVVLAVLLLLQAEGGRACFVSLL